jgi:hypothetical protein
LRVTIFTWVVSLLVVSYRRGWAKILCARCRTKYALLFDLQNLLMGWWGFPFGILWTLEGLWHNSMGGRQPAENNALLLAGLGYELNRNGEFHAAVEALEGSLKLKDDPRLHAFYWQVKAKLYEAQTGATSERLTSAWQRLITGALHPAVYCAPLLAVVLILGYILVQHQEEVQARVETRVMTKANPLRDATVPESSQDHLQFPGDALRDVEIISIPSVPPGAEIGPEGVTSALFDKFRKAKSNLKRKATSGDTQAQFLLSKIEEGCTSVFGIQQTPNMPEALKWLRQAAEGGHVEAQSHLADLYSPILPLVPRPGVQKDCAEATKWYCKAAENGSWECALRLETLCSGPGRKCETNEMAPVLTQLAEGGNRAAIMFPVFWQASG